MNNTKYESLQEQSPREIFVPAAQAYAGNVTIYVRTEQSPQSAVQSIRKVINELDPKLPITNMKTLDQQLNESVVTERMIATLSTGFSILATLLAVIGLYGVMSYTVTRRAREIAIRMALGALKGNVIWLVMREVLLLVAVGIAVAIPVALALAHLVQAELYGLQPTDPFSIALRNTAAGRHRPPRRLHSRSPRRRSRSYPRSPIRITALGFRPKVWPSVSTLSKVLIGKRRSSEHIMA